LVPKLDIGRKSLFLPQLGGPPTQSNYCHNLWRGITRMVCLPGGEKNWGQFYSFRQNTRTWQTDRWTPHDSILAALTHSIAQQLSSKWVSAETTARVYNKKHTAAGDTKARSALSDKTRRESRQGSSGVASA